MTFNYDEICKTAGLEMLCRKNWGPPVAKKNMQDFLDVIDNYICYVTLEKLYSKVLNFKIK